MSKKLIYLISFVLVSALVLTSAAKAGLDDDPNLVAWWKLDGDANDSSGNDYHGTINGDADFAEDSPFDSSEYLVLDGDRDFIDVNFDSTVLVPPIYTVSLWFRAGGSAGPRDILSSYIGPGDDRNHGFLFERSSNGQDLGTLRYIHRHPYAETGQYLESIFSENTYDDELWHHIAAVRESETSRVLYVDGKVAGTEDEPKTAFDQPMRVVIGALDHYDGIGRDWDGAIEDVRVYSRALSLEEIQELGIGQTATRPNPLDRTEGVERDTMLSWWAGWNADTHDVYFGTDYDKVNDANSTDHPDVEYNNVSVEYYDPGLLGLDTTYYWRIDEVNDNDPNLWRGDIWRFTTGKYLAVEDFEEYVDTDDLNDVWLVSGSDIYLENTIANDGNSMAIDFNNAPSPYYTEAYADTTGPNSLELDFGKNWLLEGVKALSLWFRGFPDMGSFTEDSGIYTIEGAGWTIWGTADGFHYAYKTADSYTWQIMARVDSIENTDTWAKAGVMVRETLDPNSRHAMVVVTPESGVAFQYREHTGGDSEQSGRVAGITAPHWVRLTRTGTPSKISADHANDVGGEPDVWTKVGDNLDMVLTTHIGLCVTSSNSGELCTAVFSDVTILDAPNGDPIAGEWADQDIGVLCNNPEPVYVVLEDSDSNAIWYYPDTNDADDADPNATQIGSWTEWMIELSKFSVQGIDPTDVQRMYIGVGDRYDPCEGGSGVVHIDDIRLYRPCCILSERSADFAKADYAPVLYSESGDCVVDYREIEIMGSDWLLEDEIITPTTDPGIAGGLVAYYPMDEGIGSITADDSGNDHTGTLEGGVSWVTPGLSGNSAIHVDGSVGSRISIGDWNPADPNLTISAWIRWSGQQIGYSQGIVSKRDGWDAETVMFMFETDTPGTNGALQFRQYGDAETDVSTATDTMMQHINRWTPVAVTYDGNDATIYLWGSDIGSGPFSFGGGTGATMTIGNTMSSIAWADSPESFNGDIDEVRIYNRALSAAEIAYLADTTPGDNELCVPVLSWADLYDNEDEGERSVNFKDFALVAQMWLEEELWP